MRSTHPGRIWSVILACLLFSLVLARDESRKERAASVTAADEAALRALAEGFYTSYAKKDLDGFLQLWSAQAPELAARREIMQKLFADHEKIEIKGLVIRKMAVEGEKAKLRVELEMSAIEVKTGKPAADLGKMIRALEGVKEEGAWKVWHEATAEEYLAAALALLKTDAERSALLTAEKELVTERLVREMIRQGISLRTQGNYPEALARFRLAQNIAEQIGDKSGIASTLTNIGDVHIGQGNFAQALEDYQKSLAMSEALGDKTGISRALRGIGNVHYSQGNYAQALEHFQKCLAMSEALGDKAGIASMLGGIGNIHYSQGNYAQALEHYQQSLAMSEALGDKDRIARTLNNIGNVHDSQGNYAQALEHFQKSMAMSEALGDKAGIASALNNIGNVHFFQGNYALALEHFQRSLAMSEALGDKTGISRALRGIGNVHYSQGNYALALEHYQKCLALNEALGDKPRVRQTLNSIGVAHSSQGNYALALEYFQKSLALSEALGDKNGIAFALNGIGNVHSSQGNYALALEYFQKRLALSEAMGDKAGISLTLYNIGSVHYYQGNYALALEHFQKRLTLSAALGDKTGIAFALSGIGTVHYNQGNYALALEHYQKSLALSEALGDKNGISRELNNIGNVHSGQGNYAQALEYFQKSLALSEALGDKNGISNRLNNIGNVYYSQGNHPLALEYYQKRLTLSEALGDRAGIAFTLSGIGNVHSSQGNYALALEHFQRSLTLSEALGDKARVSNALIGLGNAGRLQGNYAQALDFAARATLLAKQFGYPTIFWRAQTTAGQSYRALNQLTSACQAFEEAITTIETLRAQVAGGEQDMERFFEDKLVPYQAMVELLVSQNQSSAALAYAERAKARVLLDVLHSGLINVTKAMTAAEQEKERGFNNHLVSLNTQISRENQRSQPEAARLDDLKTQLQKARLDYEAFRTGLYAAHPELKAQRGEIEPLTLEQARALLPDTRSALLEYVVTDERTYLFALTGNAAGATTELKVYPLAIKRKELDDRVARFRETLANGSPGFRQPARELYDLLLKPAAAQLEGRTSLVIVPDGALWELPFQALQPDPARYLVEDCAIAYAPSLTALREMIKLRDGRKDSAGSPTLLAFGNPALGKQTITRVKSVLMDEKLDPLPEAERQVNVIKQIYGTTKSKVYIGAEAREERAKAEAGSYRILHLATHGILNNSSPMYSHLVLAQAEGDTNEDGLLEAWEIMKLDLKADLAVLSACETARGRVGAGEGMIGLSWALFVAGCPTTVVSQWKVDSASTTELMLEFHRQLTSQMASSAGSFSAARALREAALKLQRSNQYRHPFYWAGFVVAGKGF